MKWSNNKMKLLTLGTLGIITAPILAVISCGDTPAKRRDEARAKEQAKTKSEKLNRLTKEIKELIIIIVNYKTANRSGHIPANSINRFITNSTLAGLKYLLEQKEREIYPLLVEKLKPLYQQKQKERAEELTQDIKAYKTLRDDPNRAYDKPR
jgi:hypothetical protein